MKSLKKIEKGIIYIKDSFPRLSIKQWDSLFRFLLEMHKEIEAEKSIRCIILLATLYVEKIVNIIFIKMYGLDKYERFSPDDFLENINLYGKIEMLKRLKAIYKKKQPRINLYDPPVLMNGLFMQKLRKKIGDDIFNIFRDIESEICKEKNIKTPPPLYLRFKNRDYLDDDIIDYLRLVDVRRLDKIRQMRNIVAHKWDYRDRIAKILGVKKSNLNYEVKQYCLVTLDCLSLKP